MTVTTQVSMFILIMFTISCISSRNYSVRNYDIDRLSHEFQDTLKTKNKRVTEIEIIFTGNLGGEAIFEIENGAGRFKKVQLKGNINEIYRTDWYDSQCLIRYIPKGEINSGNIQLEYLLR
jgi:hypothetical protein